MITVDPIKGITYDQSVTLVTEICCECGIVFSMPLSVQKIKIEDKSSFYCPNGHAQYYTGSKVAKLEKELQEAKQKAERMEQRFWDSQHEKGNCPYCKKHYNVPKNLYNHIIKCHPAKLV